MFSTLAAVAAHVLADPPAAPPAGPTINTTGIVTWAVKFIVPLILLLAGLAIAASFAVGHGQVKQAMNKLTGIIIGLAVAGSGVVIFGFATGIVSLLFGH